MSNKICYPEGFRFDSDLSIFKKVVDYTKTMLEKKQLLIVYGFVKEIECKFMLSDDEYSVQYGEISRDIYNDILYSEILVIFEQNYNEPIEIEEDLIKYLRNENMTEDEIVAICNIKLEKRKYVYEQLYSEKDKQRYILKKQSLNRKLSGIKYNISKSIDVNGGMLYADIKLKTDYALPDANLPQKLVDMLNSHQSEEIVFVCDEKDIEYLIEELRTIQASLQR